MVSELNGDRRHSRPPISIGSIVGFTTVGVTVLIAVFASTLWLGGLDRSVSDTSARMDRLERDSAAFQNDMRTNLLTISQQLVLVQIQLAKIPGEGRSDARLRSR